MAEPNQLECLEPAEVCALVQLFQCVPDGTMLFVGDTLTLLDDAPGIKSLATKLNAAGKREDVRKYIKENYE